MKRKVKNLIIASSAFLFIPFFASALIYQYPTINGVTINSKVSLGGAIKYYVAWAIILGAIAAFISLIRSGILYMSSAGQPANQKKAMGGVTNAFIGLFILLTSYLILETINPQITVMRIQKQAVKTGAIFLSNSYVKNHSCGSPISRNGLSELLDNREATYLGYSTEDTLKSFGGEKILKEDPNVDLCEFQKSSPRCLYFFDDNVRIYAYPETGFKGNPIVYEKPEGGKVIDIENDIKTGKFNSEVSYELPNRTQVTGKCNHPPLSLKVEILYPGVYLYSDKLGDSRFIGTDKSSLDGLLFDDKTVAVEIRNHKKNNPSADDYDYLAALYEENGYGGNFKLFFANKERPINSDGTKKISSGNATAPQGPPSSGANSLTEELVGKVIAWIKDLHDNIVQDEWGKVKGVSSVKSFRMANGDPTCQEVMFCSEPNFQGECIDYYLEGTTPPTENKYRYLATETMSNALYQIADLPDKSHKVTTTMAPTPPATTPQTKESYFAENIASIKIKGRCLVALWERTKNNIKSKGVGGHSRLFKSSVSDLSGYKTNTCGEVRIIARLHEGHSCVKSFSIFPLER